MSQDATRAIDPRTADVYDVLDELSDVVEAARAMPMSDKCVVNRNEVLDLLDAIRQMLPTAVQEAEELLADRVGVVEEAYREAERAIAEATAAAQRTIANGEQMIAEATAEAQRTIAEASAEADRIVDHAARQANAMIDQAAAQQGHMVSAHEVTLAAHAEADAIRAQVAGEVDQMRHEVDQYVEAKLAAFEASLSKTLVSVQRARDRMHERFGYVDLIEREG